MNDDIELPQGYEPHELPADYTGLLWIEGQMRALARAAVLAERERIADYFSHALQSDLENGVKWLNEVSASEFHTRYPALVAAIRRLNDESEAE